LFSLQLQTLPASDFEVIVVNDGGENDMVKVIGPYADKLDLHYYRGPKFQPLNGRPPRNSGARLARAPHVVFIDSDIILDRNALALYAEDFAANPLGAVAGLYDWLPPCRIDSHLVEAGLDAIYELEPITLPDGTPDEHIKLKIPLLPFPQGHATHNTARDMRRPMFMATDVSRVYTGISQHANVYLGMFSGNLGFNLKAFFKSGGYWDDLTAGLVDDGALGLTWAVLAEYRDAKQQLVYADNAQTQTIPVPEFGIRLDKRIRACHQYHDRNVNFVQQQSAREVVIINRRFRLEQFADGRPPILPRSLEVLTLEAQESWGVDHWNKEF
jgi:hypothetical protein